MMARYLPILAWLPSYQRAWLRADIVAGITVVALLVPEGMAYAELAGMPPATISYAAPAALSNRARATCGSALTASRSICPRRTS
jgi:SulP family sulfate permease